VWSDLSLHEWTNDPAVFNLRAASDRSARSPANPLPSATFFSRVERRQDHLLHGLDQIVEADIAARQHRRFSKVIRERSE
jgi:hypothetical protein